MSEWEVVRQTDEGPLTLSRLLQGLRELGLEPGMTVLVHSSLSRLGWVPGGAQAVVMALLEVLAPGGTLMMPTHSADFSDPGLWQHPPVPESWWEPIRQEMPAFDVHLTPARQMGAIVETFLRLPGVLRSYHPAGPFAAFGPHAERLTAAHGLAMRFGEQSPLARLYDLDGWVLLLGVGHSNNTSLHLAEARADYTTKRVVHDAGPLLVEGRRQWVTYSDLDWDSDDFDSLGAGFDALGHTRTERVGNATARFMPQRKLVDFAVQWMESNR